MTLKKGLLILAFLTTSEFLFFSCSEQKNNELILLEKEEQSTRALQKVLISEYDPIIRREAVAQGYDWRWVSAIGFHESRFQNDVRSHCGAVGVMQVMPNVARSLGVSSDSIQMPEVNIATAVRLLKRIEESINFGNAPRSERLKIILACYNGGIGHILDARRLAAKYGANYNNWSELEKYVKLKGTPEYVDDETVRNGAFRADETIEFVRIVMQKYSEYCGLTAV